MRLLALLFWTCLICRIPGTLSLSATTPLTYKPISPVIGSEELHAQILEIEFDEELYLVDSMVCGCITNTTCAAKTLLPVNESAYTGANAIFEMQPGVVYTRASNSSNASGTRFKFTNPIPANGGCPRVVITFSNIIGLSLLYINTQGVASASRNDNFFKTPWSSHESWVFCPDMTYYGFGTWYMTVLDRYGTGSVYNISYQILDDLPTCSSLPPYNPTIPAADQADYAAGKFQLFTPGISQDILLNYTDADPYQYAFFRYYVPNNALCSNFSVSARRIDRTFVGDADFYVSVTNKYPTLQTSYNWSDHLDDDGSVTVWNVCTDTPPLVFSLGIYSLFSDGLWFRVTMTPDTSQDFVVRIADMSPLQISQSLTNVAVLDCMDTSEPAILPAEYLPYDACYIDQYKCGWPFGPISPLNEPNPFFPANPSFTDVFSVLAKGVPWYRLANFTDIWGNTNNPNKLAFVLAISYMHYGSDTTGVQVFLQNDWNQCQLYFKDRVVGASGASLPTTPFPLVQKSVPCVNADIIPFSAAVNDIIALMQQNSQQLELTILETELTFLFFRDTWIGCQQRMDYFLIGSMTSEPFLGSTSCSHTVYSTSASTDPCCAYSPQLTKCCYYDQLFDFFTFSSSNVSLVEAECSQTICVEAALKSYRDEVERTEDPNGGCTANFVASISESVIYDKIKFSKSCRYQQLFQDLGGQKCSDFNCSSIGATCNTETGRCFFNVSQIIDCWADYLINTDPELGQTLWTGIYQYAEPITLTNLLGNLTARYSITDCLGVNAVIYHDHYSYTLDLDGCTDECATQDLAPNCLDLEPEFCFLPEVCTIASSTCYRSWKLLAATTGSCTTWECNWFDCAGLSEAACQTQCLAGGSNCISDPCYQSEPSATEPQCTFYPTVTDQATCLLGVCDFDSSLNATECAKNGFCNSIDSAGVQTQICNSTTGGCDETYCLSLASCPTTQALVDAGLAGVGVCLSPFEATFYGEPTCQTTSFLNIGCTTGLTQAQCTAPNLWIPPSTNQSECESVYSCFTDVVYLVDVQNQTACTAEASPVCTRVWQPVSTWTVPTWVPANMLPRQWVQPQFYNPRSSQPSLDFGAFQEDLTAAVFVEGASAYSTAALCKYGSTDSAIRISCSCSTDPTCTVTSSSSQLVGVEVGCYLLSTSFTSVNNTFQLHSYQDTVFAADLCIQYQLGVSSSTLHVTTGAKLNSAVFFPPPPNPFSVVLNDNEAIIGQLVSDGVSVTISAPVANPFGLCIRPDDSIIPSSQFPVLGFAWISNTSDTVHALPNPVETTLDGLVCSNVTQQGIYFVVYLQEDWPSITSYGTSSIRAQAIAASVLYFILSFLSLIVLVMVWFPLDKWDLLTLVKRFMLMGFFAYAILRGIFFALPPYTYRTSAVAGLLLFEIPTFLYLICYITLLYVWGTFLGKTWEAQHKKDPSKAIFGIYITVILLVLLIFVVFLIAFYTLPTPSLDCVSGSVGVTISEQKKAVNLTYTIYVATLSIILGVFVVILAILVIWPLYKSQRNNPNESAKKKLVVIIKMAAIISVFTSTAFIAKSILVLVSAASGQLINVIVFALLEFISSIVFLWYFMPPLGKKKKGGSKKGSTAKTQSTTR